MRKGPPEAVSTRRRTSADFAAAQTLVHGVVFAVDGEKFAAGFFCGGHDQFAGGDENFFVGERDGFAEFYGFVGGFQADHTHGGGYDDFRASQRADGEHAFAPVMNGGQRGDFFCA